MILKDSSKLLEEATPRSIALTFNASSLRPDTTRLTVISIIAALMTEKLGSRWGNPLTPNSCNTPRALV